MTIHFRSLRESDLLSIKDLHEELFPVKYTNDFYHSVVKNETIDGRPLYSCVAVTSAAGFQDDPQNRRPLSRLAQHLGLRYEIQEIHRPFVPHVSSERSFNKKHEEDNYIHHSIISDNSDFEFLEDGILGNQNNSIVGVIVGAFTSVHDTKIEMIQNLIRNPSKHPKLFYIMTLGTSKSMRRKGLSSKLLQDCLQFVQQVKDCGALYLHVITHNSAAIKFYEKLGFVRVEEVQGKDIDDDDL